MARSLRATLAALRHKLQTSDDFSETWDQFHDDVAVASIQRRVGVPADNPRLAVSLEAIGRALYRRPGAAHGTWFLHVADSHFWHGSTTVAGRVAICFYFDDVEMGLAGFMRSLHSSEVDLARLRVLEVPEAWSPPVGVSRWN